MTDTITLPSGVEVYDGRLLVVPGASTIVPVGDLTPAEVSALRADVAGVLGMTLGDLANVSEAGKATGMVIAANADGTWSPIEPQQGLVSVWDHTSTAVGTNVTSLHARNGLTVVAHPTADGYVFIEARFAGSGIQTTAARSDHAHPPTLASKTAFDKAAAVLSSGDNLLVDFTVTGLVSTVAYDVSILGTLEAVNTNTSGRLRLRTQIGDFPEQSIGRGFSGGVWTEVSAQGKKMGVTGVTSLRLRFWAEYSSGDPTALYTGELGWVMSPRGGQT